MAEEVGSPGNSSGAVIKSGVLTKRAVKSGGNWKLRYFELTSDKLLYYTDEETKEYKGDFEICADSHVHYTNSQCTFKLVTPGKILDVVAASHEEMDDWIGTLRTAIAA